MAPILAANPVQQIKKSIGFSNITDTADATNAKTGFKSQISCGLQIFKASQFERALHSWTKLVEECPGASGSLYAFNWTGIGAMKKIPEGGSAWTHRDCPVWRLDLCIAIITCMALTLHSMLFINAQDEQGAKVAIRQGEELMAEYQDDQKGSALFPNHTRVASLDQRYQGNDTRRKLTGLKEAWDPQGCFTKQFL